MPARETEPPPGDRSEEWFAMITIASRSTTQPWGAGPLYQQQIRRPKPHESGGQQQHGPSYAGGPGVVVNRSATGAGALVRPGRF